MVLTRYIRYCGHKS